MYLKGLQLEVTLHSLHSNCKNLQKSVLTNVNIQRTGKTSLQMFVYFIFDGSHICSFLPILRPPTVPRSHFSYPQNKGIYVDYQPLIFVDFTFCIGK